MSEKKLKAVKYYKLSEKGKKAIKKMKETSIWDFMKEAEEE